VFHNIVQKAFVYSSNPQARYLKHKNSVVELTKNGRAQGR